MAYKSKCTCKHRIPMNVWNWQYPHEEGCYYVQALQDRQDRQAEMESFKRLYSHYSREAKQKGPK